ncbi:MAG: aldolase/citrate lyase family protein [Sedimentibacter sp.]|uniref:HpcH/HpaI aldolase family protein n=1 Tax=Sedimentibacter sp. TaxID=1960295 RepID=UPI0031584D6C
MRIKGQKTMKQRLLDREILLGTFVKLNCPQLVEMLGFSGLDFVIIDSKHGAYSYADLQDMVRVSNGVSMNAIVRIPSITEESILHSCDIGAQGIQVPNANTLEEITFAAEHMRYHPYGKMEFALTTRASMYTFCNSLDHINYVNNELLSVIMIENLEMAGRIQEICQIPQIDVLFIGVENISQSIGKRGQTNDPEVLAIVRGITETAMKNGKYVGVYAGTIEEVKMYSNWGIQLIAYISEMVMIATEFKEVCASLMAIRDESNM